MIVAKSTIPKVDRAKIRKTPKDAERIVHLRFGDATHHDCFLDVESPCEFHPSIEPQESSHSEIVAILREFWIKLIAQSNARDASTAVANSLRDKDWKRALTCDEADDFRSRAHFSPSSPLREPIGRKRFGSAAPCVSEASQSSNTGSEVPKCTISRTAGRTNRSRTACSMSACSG